MSARWFGRRGGRLHGEGTALEDLVDALDGRAAWVISLGALREGLAGDDGAASVRLAEIGAPALMSLIARTGRWARVASSHELRLALQAGFPRERVVVPSALADDGLIRDALTERVAVIEADAAAAENVARIARALDLPVPPGAGAPAPGKTRAFDGVGGLLAQVVRPAPDVRLDAVLDLARGSVRILPLRRAPGAGPAATVSLCGLGETQGRRARLAGDVARGDWVFLPDPTALAPRARHPAYPMPRTVLIDGRSHRVLDERPLPPDG